jgi:hypothetical protein
VNVDLTQLPLPAVHKSVRLTSVDNDGVACGGDYLRSVYGPCGLAFEDVDDLVVVVFVEADTMGEIR